MVMAMLIDFSTLLLRFFQGCLDTFSITGKRPVGQPRKRKEAPPVPQTDRIDGASENPSPSNEVNDVEQEAKRIRCQSVTAQNRRCMSHLANRRVQS